MKIGTFFVLLAVVAGIVATTQSAFADHMTAEVSMVEGSGLSQDCEATQSCYEPFTVTIDVGGEVIWTNPDSQPHTVTSGNKELMKTDEVGENYPDGNGFDSGLMMKDQTWSHTFDVAGEYEYFCIVHPWMAGMVIVQEAEAAEEDGEMMEEEVMEEAMMSGVNLNLDIDPMLPFDKTTNDMITLSFTAKSDELKGSSITPGMIDHLDYKVIISKDGNEVWSESFHDHDGNLELQITPTEGSFSKTGGEDGPGQSSTGPYMIKGPIFMDNGNYEIAGQIVGIEFNPLPTPLTDNFTIEVVPEFGPIVMVTLAIAIVSTLIVTAKTRVIQKL